MFTALGVESHPRVTMVTELGESHPRVYRSTILHTYTKPASPSLTWTAWFNVRDWQHSKSCGFLCWWSVYAETKNFGVSKTVAQHQNNVWQRLTFAGKLQSWYIDFRRQNMKYSCTNLWDQRVLFNLIVIINFLVSSFRFIWIPMLWV